MQTDATSHNIVACSWPTILRQFVWAYKCLTGFKLYATSANNCQPCCGSMQTDATCWAQQCCVRPFAWASKPTDGFTTNIHHCLDRCIHLIQKRLSSELLHCALQIFACQDHKALWSTLLPWLTHECRCLTVDTYDAI